MGAAAARPPGSGASSLAALALTCRRWRRLAAREAEPWEEMCRCARACACVVAGGGGKRERRERRVVTVSSQGGEVCEGG